MHLDTASTKVESLDKAQAMAAKLRVPDGGELFPPAEPTVPERDLLARFGIPVLEDWRGQYACTTCRARVAASWRGRVEPSDSTELEVLTRMRERDPQTRLLCGLRMPPDLDGVELEPTSDARPADLLGSRLMP